MKINQVIVLKETRVGEGRVALTPNAVNILVNKHLSVMVESQAGALAGFTDEEYIKAGAKIFTLNSTLPSQSIILRVKCPTLDRESLENTFFSSDTIMMGFLDPLNDDTNHIIRWQSLGLKLISLELLPLTADDPRNVQAAMSHFAGRLALQDALNRYKGSLPKKVTVFGSGPAGMGAAFTARDLGLPVQLFARQECFRKKFETANIIYHVLPKADFLNYIYQHLIDQTIIITAARCIGIKAPLLIDDKTLTIIPAHAVLVDLSAGEGSSIIGSKQDKVIAAERGIAIMNVSGYPKAEPHEASKAFSNCMVNLLSELITPEGKFDFKNPLLSE